MYDDSSVPVWGQMVDEEPESELEELKAAQHAAATQSHIKQQIMAKRQKSNRPLHHNSHQGEISIATSTMAPTKQVIAAAPKAAVVIPEEKVLQDQQSGQKEIPLLRPPSMKGKTPETQNKEPVLSVEQRSRPVEKPSPYDTLRKYLSLEDALRNVRNYDFELCGFHFCGIPLQLQ